MLQFLRSPILCLTFLSLLVSCGENKKIRLIQSATSGKEVMLNFGKAYRIYSMEELDSVTVTIKSVPPATQGDLTKTLSDAKLVKVLTALGLHAPSEPGAASALITGSVVIHFKLEGLPDRKLNILNSRLVEDSSYVETYYHPKQMLDRAWLEKQ